MAISAIVAGGIWGLIPGFFKAKWNTNETLFTLMMNYIAIQLTSFAVSKWENGSADPSTTNLLAVAKLYDVPAEELLREVER